MQAVDLVANCPDQIISSQPASRAASPVNSWTPSSPSMGQRPSSVGLLRPKISLTWVLRNQQQQYPREQQQANATVVPQQDLKDKQAITDLQIIDDTKFNKSKENVEQERVVRRSIKSVKSIKSLKSIKSIKSIKNSDGSKSKEKNMENIDRQENHEKRNVTLQRVEKIDKIEKIAEKDTVIPTENELEKCLEKDSQELKDCNENKRKVKRAISEPNLITRELNCTPNGREKHRHRRSKRNHKPKTPSKFGYEITDLDSFLTKASIEHPANIPVVLSFSSVLYQTQGRTQAEIALPLGTVVNAVFKNQTWLYVQTPHGEEGYVGYAACLPLGILPQTTRGPCWEDSTDVFPKPLGNLTDTEKLRDTRSECGSESRRHTRRAFSAIPREFSTTGRCGTEERSVDRLYLRATAGARGRAARQRLLVVREDYEGQNLTDALSVTKGDVVSFLGDNPQADWLWVRSRDGSEGFIPALVTGLGYL